VNAPDGVAFGPDLNFYGSSATQNLIALFNGTTGALLNTFVAASSGGLLTPRQVLFLPPRAPNGLAATASSSTQIDLAWTDNSDDETAFAIWRKSGAGTWARVGVVPPNSTSFSDTGLTPATSYDYRVRAISNVGASLWTSIATTVTRPQSLAAPTDFTVNAVSSCQIKLTWTDNSTNETAFEIWRKVGSGNWVFLSYMPANSISFTDTNVSGGISYTYTIRAINSPLASSFATAVTVTALP
jgi:hypothetical protein